MLAGALTAVATIKQRTAAAVIKPKVNATALLSATEPTIIPAMPAAHTTMTTQRTTRALDMYPEG